MEWQVAAVPNLIGGPPSLGTWVDTGAPAAGFGSGVQIAELAGGLAPSTSYHWRMRIASRSPFFPHTPWLSVAPSVPSLTSTRSAPASAMSALTSGSDLALTLVQALATLRGAFLPVSFTRISRSSSLE